MMPEDKNQHFLMKFLHLICACEILTSDVQFFLIPNVHDHAHFSIHGESHCVQPYTSVAKAVENVRRKSVAKSWRYMTVALGDGVAAYQWS